MSHLASYHELPPEAFPVTLIAFRKSDGEEVWRATVEQPDVPLYVPPLAMTHGPVVMRVEFGDGEVIDPR